MLTSYPHNIQGYPSGASSRGIDTRGEIDDIMHDYQKAANVTRSDDQPEEWIPLEDTYDYSLYDREADPRDNRDALEGRRAGWDPRHRTPLE